MDRKKDMIIRGGYNIYSIEVENALYEHPAIVEAAVLGVPHQILGQDILAVVRLAQGASLDIDALHVFLADRLADYKHPNRMVINQDPLPRTSLDKVDKLALRAELELDPQRPSALGPRALLEGNEVPLAHGRARWRIVVATAVVIVLGAAGFVVIRYVFREHPGPKSLHAAVKAFQGKEPTPTSSGTLRNDLPAEGVYPLNGQGTERISFPPNSQRDGAVMPVTITYLADGCWRWHIDYNVAHWEEYDFCPRGGRLLLAGNRDSQSWDFGDIKVNNLGRFTCPSGSVVLPQRPQARADTEVLVHGHQYGRVWAEHRCDHRSHRQDGHVADRGRRRPHHP